jgi:hypothetical protein
MKISLWLKRSSCFSVGGVAVLEHEGQTLDQGSTRTKGQRCTRRSDVVKARGVEDSSEDTNLDVHISRAKAGA